MPKKLTADEFIQRCRSIHGSKYDYSSVNYISSHEKVCVTCRTHGDFLITPVAHTSLKQGCIKCANEAKSINMRSTLSRFVEMATGVHGDTYDYSNTTYIDAHTPVTIRCMVHGSFSQTPTNHIHQAAGCPVCGTIRGADLRTTSKQEFIDKSVQIHGTTYDYSLVPPKVKLKTPVTIVCPTHGEFRRVPEEHIWHYKVGCPSCGRAESRGERLVKRFLDEHNIVYIQQHEFLNCRGNSRPLKFDFYLPLHGAIIEYDGEQHYRYIPWIHKTRGAYDLCRRYDAIKNQYCVDNDVRLCRISSKEEQGINQVLEEFLYPKNPQNI